MFKRLTPQSVQHNSGFIVQTGDRYSIQYLDGELVAAVKADFASVTGLYPDTMTVRPNKYAPSRPATPEEIKLVMDRIESALNFLGEKYEICKGDPS